MDSAVKISKEDGLNLQRSLIAIACLIAGTATLLALLEAGKHYHIPAKACLGFKCYPVTRCDSMIIEPDGDHIKTSLRFITPQRPEL